MHRQGAYVFIGGATLALFGLYGMWAGWDLIQLERGWAQFIAGSVAVSGGSVVMALSRVIKAVGAAADRIGRAAPPEARTVAPPAPPPEARPVASPAPPAPARAEDASKPRAGLWPPRPAPVEVDRYTMGDAEYVMLSDGSVEVRSGGRVQRYASVAALRADAARRG